MTDQGNVTVPPRRGRRGTMAAVIILVAIAAGVVGSVVTDAFGQAAGWRMGAMMDGPFDPARVDRQVERAIKHMAVEADATTEQQTKLVAVAKAAVNDLLPLREKAMANRKQALALFTAPSIDRAAIERLRTDQMALAETASKRVAQALGDAADVLNADQRRTLTERLEAFGHWRHWHRG